MAETFIALLYSIGISGGRRLMMADWRAMMEEIGFQNPRTLIATGNAVFESDEPDARKLEASLEDAFELRFGRRVDVIVRSASSFRRMTSGNPFPKESRRDGARVAVRVMREPLAKDRETALQPYLTQGERVKIIRGDLWIHFKHEPVRSRLMPVLASKRLGTGTVRNWNTIRRLGEMLD
ncbi:MAG TPA: DUF1697 domain-containing protein [Chthoniobacteraceae bacterium]|nr:DUF1697 domain-containing protein [Chthoniobacteraceae bacterium]